LGEIETVLGEHLGVEQAVVELREDERGDKGLVAYVVVDGSGGVGAEELRGYLKDRLPGYMVPAVYVFLDELPLNPNGKVDRHSLPEPVKTRMIDGESIGKPRNALDEVLVDIWREVLDVDYVSIHDDFFELGGHSILAIRVLSRIENSLQIDLPVIDFFENSTIADLSNRIERLLIADREAELNSIYKQEGDLFDE
jgi:acyl carrier protein